MTEKGASKKDAPASSGDISQPKETKGSGLVLVTGAAGRLGGVGRTIVHLLRAQGVAVRAMVHKEDDRAVALRATGAETIVGDLLKPADIARALQGCRRAYFGMSVQASYLEATVMFAAVARETAHLDMLVNMSQMTVSQMSITKPSDSSQQMQHWLGEQVLNWSGLPVVHVRPTAFLEHFFFLDWAAESIVRDGTIHLPFGKGHTSPIAAHDVAAVVAKILTTGDASAHVGKVYDLTGARAMDMPEMCAEYSKALARPVTYVDEPMDQWLITFRGHHLDDHVAGHIQTMAALHAADRYNRLTHTVEDITGHPATTVREFVEANKSRFQKKKSHVSQPASA